LHTSYLYWMVNKFIEHIFNIFSRKLSEDSNECNLKLIQSLVLCPGQNLYVVEAYNRKILLGGTVQGGIHFLTDLTPSQEKGNNGKPKNNFSEMLSVSTFMPHDLLPPEELPLPEKKLDISIPTYKQSIKKKLSAVKF